MRKIKAIIGVFLILISVGSLLFWEIKGRDVFLLSEVLVANTDIHYGEKIHRSMFRTVGVLKENKLEGALTAKDFEQMRGKIAAQLILKNDQISARYFRTNDFYLQEGESFFVIEPEWITMMSSSLRRGDLVDFYCADGRGKAGTFRVAFVKDDADREIKDAKETGLAEIEPQLLNRTDSTAEISHFEIIATVEQYGVLTDFVYGSEPTTFIIVQRGETANE